MSDFNDRVRSRDKNPRYDSKEEANQARQEQQLVNDNHEVAKAIEQDKLSAKPKE